MASDCRQSPRHPSRAFLVNRAEKVSIYKTLRLFFDIINVSKYKMYPIDWTIPVFKTLTIRQQVLKETLVFEQ